LLARMRELGGLNEPHSLFGGRIAAQAYDNAVFKVAADELVLSSGAQVLFHAQAVVVVMREPGAVEALLVETKSGRYAILGRVSQRLRKTPGIILVSGWSVPSETDIASPASHRSSVHRKIPPSGVPT